MRIGFCGMGKMGATMAARLMTFGHALTVWNRDTAKTVPLAKAGAAVAKTPAELAGAVDCVITMLTDAQALDAVYRGPHGLLSADLTGKLVIDMSTVLPEVEAAIAADVIRHGGGFVECPVGGTVGPARDGKLFGFAGGTETDVARARPVLDQLCRRVEPVGAVGNGARFKLAINLPMLVYWQALGEALSLCKAAGMSPEKMIDIMADTTGAAAGIKQRGPDIVRGLGGTDTGPGSFDILTARKDLDTMRALAGELGLELPTAAAALKTYDEVIAAGKGLADAGQVAVYWAGRGDRS
ncbi:MAG: NAD(P)-dependent oxidoreductase [Acetobacteraceae bacterium]|nr:NAD(P)-dependent oxidoreductase [Acetobacteraceae bacterium]